jgi:hypothetical protein
MPLDKGRERMERAVKILAEEKDRVKDRLLVAYASQLCLIDAADDLPDELRNDFYDLRNQLSDAEMPYGEGEHAAEKLRGMSEDQASALAGRIFSMFLKINGLESRSPAR